MFAPGGVSPDVLEKLDQARKNVLAEPSVREQFQELASKHLD
jgi:tripartite-type tricarboxylate transporter receptor subunit TctC